VSKKRLLFLLFTLFPILWLAACVASNPGVMSPTSTPDPCQPPNGWQNAGKYIELRDSSGKIIGSIQLFIDEENGVLSLEGREPVFFPPGSKGELKIDKKTTEFYFGCDHNFYFPPGTINKE